MLKFSALQPHLTAAEILLQRSAWAKGERCVSVHSCLLCAQPVQYRTCAASRQQLFFASESLASSCRGAKEGLHQPSSNHVRTQNWHAQGQQLAGNADSTRQVSVCIQLEVKLAEALDKCDSLCPPQADDNGQPLPNKLRTAVCCKVRSQLLHQQH